MGTIFVRIPRKRKKAIIKDLAKSYPDAIGIRVRGTKLIYEPNDLPSGYFYSHYITLWFKKTYSMFSVRAAS